MSKVGRVTRAKQQQEAQEENKKANVKQNNNQREYDDEYSDPSDEDLDSDQNTANTTNNKGRKASRNVGQASTVARMSQRSVGISIDEDVFGILDDLKNRWDINHKHIISLGARLDASHEDVDKFRRTDNQWLHRVSKTDAKMAGYAKQIDMLQNDNIDLIRDKTKLTENIAALKNDNNGLKDMNMELQDIINDKNDKIKKQDNTIRTQEDIIKHWKILAGYERDRTPSPVHKHLGSSKKRKDTTTDQLEDIVDLDKQVPLPDELNDEIPKKKLRVTIRKHTIEPEPVATTTPIDPFPEITNTLV